MNYYWRFPGIDFSDAVTCQSCIHYNSETHICYLLMKESEPYDGCPMAEERDET